MTSRGPTRFWPGSGIRIKILQIRKKQIKSLRRSRKRIKHFLMQIKGSTMMKSKLRMSMNKKKRRRNMMKRKVVPHLALEMVVVFLLDILQVSVFSLQCSKMCLDFHKVVMMMKKKEKIRMSRMSQMRKKIVTKKTMKTLIWTQDFTKAKQVITNQG